jgi:hypothetical protein
MEAFLSKETCRTYTGRLLGLITEQEYAELALVFPMQQRKLFSCETISISELRRYLETDNAEGKRLVMTATEEDGHNIITPIIFITEPIEIVNQIGHNFANLSGKGKTYYTIEETIA